MMRTPAVLLAASAMIAPASAFAWGYEGHEVIADIARSYLAPDVQGKLDAILASDTDKLTEHDMAAEATWADAYRSAGHRETAQWHFVDQEIDGSGDLESACFGYPAADQPASAGPAQDCVVDKINEFESELASPTTQPAERRLALKYLLHFVGDLHQPLHASDNHDRGGNCVLLAYGGSRTVNLHSFWDTGVVQALGGDPQQVAAALRGRITPAQAAAWRSGDVAAWARESLMVAKASAYTLRSQAGCPPDATPITPPATYGRTATETAVVQLEKAGVRLAALLDRALGAMR